MQFSSRIDRFEGDLWHYHVLISAEQAEAFVQDNDRRVVCTINGTHTFQCALMPDGKGDFFINLNKDIRKKLGLVLGQEVSIILAPDESEYGLPMPEEFAELLAQDEEGSRRFHALTPGKQRSLIYQVGNVKNPDKRINRGLVILDHLKMHGGTLDFKVLNAEMKAFNQQQKS